MTDKMLIDLSIRYFKLKIERTKLKHQRSDLMANNDCENGTFGLDDCITSQNEGSRVDLCDVCVRRFDLHDKLLENSRQRSSITQKVNKYLRQIA